MSTSPREEVVSLSTCILQVGTAAPHGRTALENKSTVATRDLVASVRNATVVCNADIARDDLTGLVLGPYALGRKIGGGGMGKVFAARHLSLDRPLAVKFIRSDFVAHPDARRRFEQEVKALGKLQHPHIVNAIDAGSVDDMQYLVTEFVAGEDLNQLVHRFGPLPMVEACELIRQAAVGLAHSHRCGFLHRDIKPSNLILDTAGCVKLLDFGLVRSATIEPDLTMAGEMLGTWDFVAPEQMQDARQADVRSDLYGLGCTLLYLLSGRVPFSEAHYSTPAAKLKGHLLDQPTWLKSVPAAVPKELVNLLGRLTAKSPDDRPQSADEVVAELASLTEQADLSKLNGSAASSNLRPASNPQATISKARPGRKLAMRLIAAGVLVACGVAAFVPSRAEPSSTSELQAGPPQTLAHTPATPPDPIAPAVSHSSTDSEHARRHLMPTLPSRSYKPAVPHASSMSSSSTRVTLGTKHTHNASAVRIGISADEPAKLNRKISSAP